MLLIGCPRMEPLSSNDTSTFGAGSTERTRLLMRFPVTSRTIFPIMIRFFLIRDLNFGFLGLKYTPSALTLMLGLIRMAPSEGGPVRADGFFGPRCARVGVTCSRIGRPGPVQDA